MNDSDYDSAFEQAAKPTYTNRLKKWLGRLLRSLGIGYVVLVILLMVMENRLIYPAPKFPSGNWEPGFAFEDIEFQSEDGVNCHGWLLRNYQPTSNPRYFLLCHGNGENVAHSSSWAGLEIVHKLGGHVLVFDYRGYGKSEGSPSEAGIKLDAEKALETLCEEFGIQASDVILIGNSLGGAVAVHLAATKGCKALVLQKTFTSLPDVAESKYPFVPVWFLMRNRFDSESALESYSGPLHQSHGESDWVVPFRFGRKLFEKSSNPMSKFVNLQDVGHNDALPDGYWTGLNEWISAVEN